jgi:hypothetical protein
MLLGETFDSGDNTFTIQLPSSYAYYERSWTLYSFGGDAYFTVNGQRQSGMAGNNPWFGVLTAAQLLPDTTHAITVDDYGVLAIVYRVP